jgi:hypothetical protein
MRAWEDPRRAGRTRQDGTAVDVPVDVPADASRAAAVLQMQRTLGNRGVQRIIAAATGGGTSAGRAVLARRIAITPANYASGLGVAAAALTGAQLDEYLAMAVTDELAHVRGYADEAELNEWTRLEGLVGDTTRTMAQRTTDLADLVTSINTFSDSAAGPKHPSHKTRYATEPESGYEHGGNSPAWGDDQTMHKSFGAAFGTRRAAGGLTTAAPRGKRKQKPLTQVPWEVAKTLLPKPLLNLIFDVRYQLETGGATVIDERSDQQQRDKKATAGEAGTLRSYHQDSPEVLPANTFETVKPAKQKAKKGAAAAPQREDNVPAHAQALHDHYRTTSKTGEGSSIEKDRDSPEGYAEYTGTGTNTEHNTKVVLDYMQKRVYVTLSHYQYWALISRNGSYEFWESGTQAMDAAEGKLNLHLGKLKLGADAATMMSPWVEVLPG